jgi:hypothetical protein
MCAESVRIVPGSNAFFAAEWTVGDMKHAVQPDEQTAARQVAPISTPEEKEGSMTPETFIAVRAAESSPAEQQAFLRMQAGDRHQWNLFSPAELARLRFTRWLYQTGRIRPSAPAGAEADALYAALLTGPTQPDPEPPRPPAAGPRSVLHSGPIGVPLRWVVWAEKHGTLHPNRLGLGE